MNKQSLLIQQISNGLRTYSQRNVYKEGDSVFVKVISRKENNVYEGSVGGKRVRIFSAKNLKVGSSFVATISAKDGKILITPKETINIDNGKPFIQINMMENTQLSRILGNLGVPLNNLTVNLLKMMLQLEIKVDGNVIRNIYKMALKHKGKEKAAGEILMMLKDKGINISSETLELFLLYLEKNNYNSYKGEFEYKEAKSLINCANKIKSGWFIVPYNLIDLENNFIIGGGVIRFLYSKANILKMINFNCCYKDKDYLFSLTFENKKCKEVKFNISSCDGNEENNVKHLLSYFDDSDIKVTWCNPELIEGFGSEDKKLYTFNGEV